MDPMIDVGPLAKEAGLMEEDTKDALYELSAFFKDDPDRVKTRRTLMVCRGLRWRR